MPKFITACILLYYLSTLCLLPDKPVLHSLFQISFGEGVTQLFFTKRFGEIFSVYTGLFICCRIRMNTIILLEDNHFILIIVMVIPMFSGVL